MSKPASIYSSLPAEEKKLVQRAFFLALKTRLALWVLPAARLSRDKKNPVRELKTRPAASRVLWSVIAVTKRIPFASNCLVRAVTAQELLSRYGYESELRIGVVKPKTGRLKAHAWLEKDGEILIGEETAYPWTPLPSF